MRTRYKKLSDYGISPDEGKRLYDLCRNMTVEQQDLLCQAALSACSPGLALCVIRSLTEGKSYDELSKTCYIPAKTDDFYGYRRKTVAAFYDLLRMHGRWEDD